MFVAQMAVGFGQVIDDSVGWGLLEGLPLEKSTGFLKGLHLPEEPEMKPHVLSGSERLRSRRFGNWGAAVGAGLQVSASAWKDVGDGTLQANAAAWARVGASRACVR